MVQAQLLISAGSDGDEDSVIAILIAIGASADKKLAPMAMRIASYSFWSSWMVMSFPIFNPCFT